MTAGWWVVSPIGQLAVVRKLNETVSVLPCRYHRS
jgi:hypothetical protein